MAWVEAHCSYNGIEISKLKNRHTLYVGLLEICLDWVFKMPVPIETR